MHYIYCYENKINHHKYVGQTNNLKVRYSAHDSQSHNINSKDYNCLFHKKIREYGLDNFDFYVLEEISDDHDEDFVDFREVFWIEKLNTWCRYGCGYNETTGGKQFRKTISVDDMSIQKIKLLLKTTDIPFSQLAIQFNTYGECISRINTGRYAFDSKEKYPIRVTREWREISQEIKEQIAQDIINTKTPLKILAEQYGISEHTITMINQGQSNLEGAYTFPLRKTNKITNEQEEMILKLLKEGKSDGEISKIAKVDRKTVKRRREKHSF